MNIISEVSLALGMSEERLKNYVSTCPRRYKRYDIPKRNGRGNRLICQPSRELKFLQRKILAEFFTDLPVHEAATAYREGLGIKENAERHKNGRYFLKIDIRNFFPSISPRMLVSHIEKTRNVKLSEDDIFAISRVFFYLDRDVGLSLSIGAPSSPFISNTIMYNFDCIMDRSCRDAGIVYTRYADDICFSSSEKDSLWGMPAFVEKVLIDSELSEFILNDEKTTFVSRKMNIHITGLVITPEGRLSIGRKNKRRVKSLVHTFGQGGLSLEELKSLKGYLAFCKDVEPTFIHSLSRKYGDDVLARITRA